MSNKTLYRSRNNKVISGVCGGLGKHFKLDPIIFRFAFVALLLAGGGGFFIYLIMLVVIPKEPIVINNFANTQVNLNTETDSAFDKFQQEDLSSDEPIDQTKTVTGLLLISGGILFLLNNLVPMFRIGKWWPVILIIIGLSLLFQSINKKDKVKEVENEK